MTNARIDWRPHLYELVIAANFILIYAMTMHNTNSVITTLPVTLVTGGGSMLVEGLIAIVVRLIIAAFRGNVRQYLAVIRKPSCIVESARVVLGATLLLHVYAWIK